MQRSVRAGRRGVVAAAAIALISAVAAPTAAAASASGTPTAALATSLTALASTAAAETCEVTAGAIAWGFKESFRSYISGTIANGEWTTADGATYATPVFAFAEPTGAYDDTTGVGTASFPGSISFTGHDGLLQTTVSNPTIALTSATTAQLLLDVSSVPMEQAMAGDETVHTVTQIPFVDIDLAGVAVTRANDVVTITATDAPTAVTAQGYEAFGNYDAGTAFDPMTLSLSATCATAASEPAPEQSSSPSAEPAPAQESDWTWLPFTIGGVAVIIAMAVGTILVRRTNRPFSDS